MTPSEAEALVRELLAEHVGTEPAAIELDMHVVDDLALDSVDAVEVLIALERRSGRRFEIEQLDDLTTVRDVVDRLLAAEMVGQGGGNR